MAPRPWPIMVALLGAVTMQWSRDGATVDAKGCDDGEAWWWLRLGYDGQHRSSGSDDWLSLGANLTVSDDEVMVLNGGINSCSETHDSERGGKAAITIEVVFIHKLLKREEEIS
ncbi:hypothetical protein F0562_015822 [Nyssa sinensis]|uniref:Uncharacterized protein n=1 Tax=Nyssa sinensis TaxID=561372 RepID=A0A5J4ZI99_9ASTE|nr:hypothetical protein F0562_015822 [Nyssa sinensis]